MLADIIHEFDELGNVESLLFKFGIMLLSNIVSIVSAKNGFGSRQKDVEHR